MSSSVVAIYSRVSTEGQDAENQLKQLREYCLQRQYSIFHEYVDVMSGKSTHRPAFDGLFSDAYKRKFDIVLFWDLSRFSRAGTLYTLQKLHTLDMLGIRWISFQEAYMDSTGAFRDVVIAIMSTLAKIEREKISERTKAGLAHAKNVGKRGKDKRKRKPREKRVVRF